MDSHDDLSVRQRVFEILKKYPNLKAKAIQTMIPEVQRKGKKQLDYIRHLRSQWIHEYLLGQGSKVQGKPNSFHKARGWVYVDRLNLGREKALAAGWIQSRNRNRVLIWKDPKGLGRMEWHGKSGRVNIFPRQPPIATKGRVWQLFCDGFSLSGLIDSMQILDLVLNSISFKGATAVWDLGVRVPYFVIDFFRLSNGLVLKGGDLSHPCFPAGTLIITRNGLQKIEEITIGTVVLTHLGSWKQVTQFYERDYSGDLCEINMRNGLKVQVTPNHPIFAGLIRRWACNHVPQDKSQCWQKLEWLPVGELTSQHYLSFPAVVQAEDITASIESLSDAIQDLTLKERALECLIGNPSNTAKSLSQELDLDYSLHRKTCEKYLHHFRGGCLEPVRSKAKFTKNVLRLIGYYIGDGSPTGDEEIKITLNGTERIKADDLIQIVESDLDRSCRVYDLGNCLDVRFSHRSLLRWLKTNVGSSAREKRLPMFTLGLELEQKIELLKGLIRSDGSKIYYGIHHTRYCYTTVSPLLVSDLTLLLLSIGVIPSIEKRKAHLGYIRGQGWIKGSESWSITIDGTSALKLADLLSDEALKGKRTFSFGFISGNLLLTPILSIERIAFRGKVYNLEVEDHHSYTTLFGSWHNCGIEAEFCLPDWMEKSEAQLARNNKIIEELMKLLKGEQTTGKPPDKMEHLPDFYGR